jgi:hypothetical protein
VSTLDPQIGITIVAIIGALAHAAVAILRAVQDYRASQVKANGAADSAMLIAARTVTNPSSAPGTVVVESPTEPPI